MCYLYLEPWILLVACGWAAPCVVPVLASAVDLAVTLFAMGVLTEDVKADTPTLCGKSISRVLVLAFLLWWRLANEDGDRTVMWSDFAWELGVFPILITVTIPSVWLPTVFRSGIMVLEKNCSTVPCSSRGEQTCKSATVSCYIQTIPSCKIHSWTSKITSINGASIWSWGRTFHRSLNSLCLDCQVHLTPALLCSNVMTYKHLSLKLNRARFHYHFHEHLVVCAEDSISRKCIMKILLFNGKTASSNGNYC